ncbi:MAG: response regulator transcription factor [Nitrospirales bacterium]|jgi:DNA-binding NarL/FixJ family response regulator
MKPFIRILMADDHKLVLQSIRTLLEEEFRIIGEIQDGKEVVKRAQELRPEVVLLDISLKPVNGFIIAEELKKRLPHIKIVFVTMHTEPTFVMRAFKIGAAGYVLKHNAASELVDAINAVVKNGHYLSGKIPEKVRDTVMTYIKGIPSQELQGNLTKRQKEVLLLLARGLTARQIGKQLNISHSTVAFHTTNIIEALGLRRRAELAKYARDNHFLEEVP